MNREHCNNCGRFVPFNLDSYPEDYEPKFRVMTLRGELDFIICPACHDNGARKEREWVTEAVKRMLSEGIVTEEYIETMKRKHEELLGQS